MLRVIYKTVVNEIRRLLRQLFNIPVLMVCSENFTQEF